jgi:hypothetical protein
MIAATTPIANPVTTPGDHLPGREMPSHDMLAQPAGHQRGRDQHQQDRLDR